MYMKICDDWSIIPYEGPEYDSCVFWAEDAQDYADAIDWAWEDGEADVLSNSWGYNTTEQFADNIINAIGRARTQGRNGNGSVVVFASGNWNEWFSGVTFPANVSGVITVGAIDNNGNIWNYSSRGSEMDLVAPSGDVGSNGDVRTIDRMGSNGYEDGNYTNSFGGTSAACPQVSGVAALMLSVNSNLYETQVRTTLQQTATDMGATGFDNTFGYGRVNACRAVFEAFSSIMSITGTSLVCSSNSTFTLHNRPSGTTVDWTPSSNLTEVTGDGTDNYTVRAPSPSTYGSGWVQATINSSCGTITLPNWNVWVGKPDQPTIVPTGYPTIEMQVGERKYFRITSSPGYPTSYHWWVVGSPCGVEIISGSTSKYCTMLANEPSWNNFYVTTSNACGTSVSAGGAIKVVDGGGGPLMPLSIKPNPANYYIEAEILDDNFESGSNNMIHIKLFNNRSILFYTGISYQKTFRINTSTLPHGLYLLQVIYKGEIYSKQLLIEH